MESSGRKIFCFTEKDLQELVELIAASKEEVEKGKSFKMVSKEIATNNPVIIQTMMRMTKKKLLERC